MSDEPVEPSEQLVLSLPGQYGVYTPKMLADAARFHVIAQELAGGAFMLLGASHVVSASYSQHLPGGRARDAQEGILFASQKLFRLSDEIAQLGQSLIRAGELYGWAEHTIDASIQAAFDAVAHGLGTIFAPLVGLVALGSLIGRWMGVDHVDRTGETTEPFDAEKQTNDGGISALLANGFAVDTIRHIVSSGDDFFAGALGPLGFLVQLQGHGTGVATTAGMLTGIAGGYGLLQDTPIAVKAVKSETTTAPSGFVENLDKIPRNQPGTESAQVTVDRIEKPGEQPSFVVYIAGTQSFDPFSKNEPFDMTSNVEGVAGIEGASFRAVEAALDAAGATSDSKVSFVGHSQGGLLAQQLAASGNYKAQSVVTIGSPGGEIVMPASVNAVLIDNVEDLVPAVGGAQENNHALQISRAVFAGDANPPAGMAVPAHHFEYYRHTAELADADRTPQVLEAKRQLDSMFDGATSVTETHYLATRIAPETSPSVPGGGGGGGGR